MTTYYQKHLFLCTNMKPDGRKCCAQGGGDDEMWAFAKGELRERDLLGEGKVRLTRSGCLGRCSEGPCLVIYPEGVWYTYACKADIVEIIEQHVQKNQRVGRLLLNKSAEVT